MNNTIESIRAQLGYREFTFNEQNEALVSHLFSILSKKIFLATLTVLLVGCSKPSITGDVYLRKAEGEVYSAAGAKVFLLPYSTVETLRDAVRNLPVSQRDRNETLCGFMKWQLLKEAKWVEEMYESEYSWECPAADSPDLASNREDSKIKRKGNRQYFDENCEPKPGYIGMQERHDTRLLEAELCNTLNPEITDELIEDIRFRMAGPIDMQPFDSLKVGFRQLLTTTVHTAARMSGRYDFSNVEPGDYLVYAEYKDDLSDGYWMVEANVVGDTILDLGMDRYNSGSFE